MSRSEAEVLADRIQAFETDRSGRKKPVMIKRANRPNWVLNRRQMAGFDPSTNGRI
jgi:hypothetical protein